MLVGLEIWAAVPTSQPPEHFDGKILSIWALTTERTQPVALMMDVELPDQRRGSVRMPYADLRHCKIGNHVALTAKHAKGGWLAVTADPRTCR